MIDIEKEMQKMGMPFEMAQILQEKDGVTVARVYQSGASWILKVFENPVYRREISNYRLLSRLNIPTLRVAGYSETAILLNDLRYKGNYRLATAEDMADPQVARGLARWYRQLHTCGYAYLRQHPEKLYDESDYFSVENIRLIKEKTGTSHLPVWSLLEKHADTVRQVLHKTAQTITYNDFYYTNMAVSKNTSAAMMFDYNMLGKGYAYADLRNVTSSLSREAGEAFLDAYGPFDPMEKLLDDVICPVVTLHLACRREQFPSWAQAVLEDVKNTYEDKVRIFLEKACHRVEYGTPEDIHDWMELVTRVRQNFPGLETEADVEDHRRTVLRFMEKQQALCIKADGKIAGVLLFSRNKNMICCLAVDRDHRHQGMASCLLAKALSELDRGKDITVTTFRAEDEKGVAPRGLYRKHGFEAGDMTAEYGYPQQQFVLRARK